MKQKQWYEELFDTFSEHYDQEDFTQGTLGEVDFIEKEIQKDKSKRILDVGCGTGRHAIELAKRGYRVTGVDLSEAQLKKAKEKAKAAGVEVDFQKADARRLDFHGRFDMTIMICEGAFPLMETDEMNFQILQSASKALKPGGKLILTTLNALFPLFHSVKDFINESDSPDMVSRENTFDLMTFRDHSLLDVENSAGEKKTLKCSERYYTPPEMNWNLKSLGFTNVHIFGCPLGKFSRDNTLTTKDFEMLVIAENYCPTSLSQRSV